MKQRDVTKRVFREAAAMIRDADFDVIFVSFADDPSVTEEQMARAQLEVVERLERLGSALSAQAGEK